MLRALGTDFAKPLREYVTPTLQWRKMAKMLLPIWLAGPAARAIGGRTYSRNSQSPTATLAESGDLPYFLGRMSTDRQQQLNDGAFVHLTGDNEFSMMQVGYPLGNSQA